MYILCSTTEPFIKSYMKALVSSNTFFPQGISVIQLNPTLFTKPSSARIFKVVQSRIITITYVITSNLAYEMLCMICHVIICAVATYWHKICDTEESKPPEFGYVENVYNWNAIN